jgi:hypothetical protein
MFVVPLVLSRSASLGKLAHWLVTIGAAILLAYGQAERTVNWWDANSHR